MKPIHERSCPFSHSVDQMERVPVVSYEELTSQPFNCHHCDAPLLVEHPLVVEYEELNTSPFAVFLCFDQAAAAEACAKHRASCELGEGEVEPYEAQVADRTLRGFKLKSEKNGEMCCSIWGWIELISVRFAGLEEEE